MRRGVTFAAVMFLAGAGSAWGQMPERGQSGQPPQDQAPANARARLGRPVAAQAAQSNVRQASDAAPATPPVMPGYVPNAADLGYVDRNSGACATCGSTGLAEACSGCGPAGRVWVNLEWLYWVTSGQSLPPLVTSASTGTGALGPGTGTLFGGQRANDDFRNGFRLSGGIWLDAGQRLGIEGDFFFIGQSNMGFTASSGGTPLLARPFINALTGLEDSQIVAAPGIAAGSVGVSSRSDIIGGGVNGICNLHCHPCGRLDFIFGYRNLSLTDDLTITESPQALAGSLLPTGTLFQITDRFETANYFNGGVIGISGERRHGSLYFGVRASIALGAVRQTADISGTTIRTLPGGAPTTFTGGLLAQTSNIGHYETTRFAVMPEIGFKVGVQLTQHCRVYAAYNFMYLSSVLRASDQIDRRVNPNLLPPAIPGGPALPSFTANTTGFWMQGVSLGLEFRF